MHDISQSPSQGNGRKLFILREVKAMGSAAEGDYRLKLKSGLNFAD
jgi:hypothetical protein